MKKNALFFILLIAVSLSQAQTNIVRIKDLIPEGNSNAVTVETHGLIYVAGQSHVVVFAQRERLALLPYINITGESQNSFMDTVALVSDKSGVWVGDKSGLGFIDGQRFTSEKISDLKNISAIAPIGNGQVLVLSSSRLFLFDRSKKKSPGKNITNKRLTGLIKLPSNKIYASDESEVYEVIYQQNKWELRPRRLNRPGTKSIFDAGDDRIGIVTDNFCILYKPNTKDSIQSFNRPNSSKVTGIKYLKGFLYVSTLDGLWRHKVGAQKKQYKWDSQDLRTIDNLPLRIILSLGLTHDSVLLIGTRAGGLLMYSPKRERLFQPFHLRMSPRYEVNDIHDFSLRSIIYDASTNTLFYGTDRGKVFKLTKNKDGKGFENQGVLELDLKDPTLQIRSLALDGKGNIIVGTGIDFGSVFIHKIGKDSTSKKEIPIEGNLVKTISSLYVNKKENELLVGTNNGLYHSALSTLESSTSMLTPLRNYTVKNIVDGLICGEKGQIYKGSAPMIKDKKDINGFDILHIAKGRGDTNTIWLFTRGASVFQGVIKDGTIKIMRPYNEKNGLTGYDGAPASVIYGGFIDKFGALWVSTNYGVYRKDKTSDQFDRFTPPVLGLPDNVDANTGAFCMINDSLIAFGFRHGGVLIHTEQYKKSNEGLIVVEKFKQDSYRLLDKSEQIQKDKPFDAINLIPFRMDWVYGGAEGIEAKFKNDSSVLMSGSIYAITPSLFNAGWVQTFGNRFEGNFENQYDVKVNYQNYPVTITGVIILILLCLIFLGWNYGKKRKRRSKIAEAEQRAKIAEAEQRTKIAEAEKAKFEAENLNAIHLLSSKALSQHFLKNNLDEIAKTANFDKELEDLTFFSSLLNMPNINPLFINEIKEIISFYKENNSENIKLLGPKIREVYKKHEPLSDADNILIKYADFFENITTDQRLSLEAKGEIIGFYTFLVDSDKSYTILEDARFIQAICLLYERNQKYQFEFNRPDKEFTPGIGDIEIYSKNKDMFEKAEFPRMLIQPLVENARKYGTKPFRMKVKYIHEILEGKDWLTVEVVNEGIWRQVKTSYIPANNKKSLSIIERIVLDSGGKWHGKEPITGPLNIPMIKVSFTIPIKIQKNA